MDETPRPRHRGEPEVAATSDREIDSPSDPASELPAESRFTVVHHPDGAMSVLFAPAQTTPSTQHSGVWRALVVSTADPLERGRLEITLPSSGQTLLWAESCLAPGDKSEPDVGEQVWVSFEEGDPQRPVWLGLVRG